MCNVALSQGATGGRHLHERMSLYNMLSKDCKRIQIISNKLQIKVRYYNAQNVLLTLLRKVNAFSRFDSLAGLRKHNTRKLAD